MLKKICWRKSFLFGSFLILGLVLVSIRSFAQSPQSLGAASEPSWKAPLQSYLQELMREYRLPGMAVQVVSNSGPIVQLTLGFRDQEQVLPVNAHTLYAIGSTTKAFTGVLLYQMLEEGRLNLDVPVRQYRPDFALNQAEYSDSITLRDMMSHRTGVARHDFVWYHRNGETRQSLFGMIPHLEMAQAPRAGFIYNNWMWLAAAVIAEGQAAKSWENLIQERLFSPLGMTGSKTSLDESKATGNYAHPYVTTAVGTNEVPFYDLGPMNPAGGIYSNLHDMAKWLQFHLNKGVVQGKRLLSSASLADSYRGANPINSKLSYAPGGWMQADFFGHNLLTHDGGIDGFAANVSLVPETGLGVVVLMNASQVAPESISLRIWQHILGLPLKDFVRESLKLQDEHFAETVRAYPDKPKATSRLPLSAYLGNYCHPVYPMVEIKAGGTGPVGPEDLQLLFSVLRHSLYPIGGDRFSILGQYDANKEIEFVEAPAKAGKTPVIESLKWNVEATLGRPIEFQRCPPIVN